MEGRRLAPLLGIAGCLAVVGIVLAPYLVADTLAVATYYDTLAIGPWFVALFALVTIIALLAGRQGRTDPVTVAGASLVFGLSMVLVATAWALSVPTGLVEQLSTAELLDYHRWALVFASLIVALSSAWYAADLL